MPWPLYPPPQGKILWYPLNRNGEERNSQPLPRLKHPSKMKEGNVVLPIVLYECETWSLTLREEHKLRVFENGVLRRIFGPKRKEEVGGWRILYNKELHNLYASPNIIRVIKKDEMGRACSTDGRNDKCI
jgi:hypothetical protein